MSQVEIISEREAAGGWEFDAQVLWDDGRLSKHCLRLSWADYNLWSKDGSDPPEHVAEAVMRFIAMQPGGDAMPAKFDAASLRRKFADADVVIPGMIGSG